MSLVTHVHLSMSIEERRIGIRATGSVQVDESASLDEKIDAA
jgi:hypothetical protein